MMKVNTGIVLLFVKNDISLLTKLKVSIIMVSIMKLGWDKSQPFYANKRKNYNKEIIFLNFIK